MAKKFTAVLDMWKISVQINMSIQMHYHWYQKKSLTYVHLDEE